MRAAPLAMIAASLALIGSGCGPRDAEIRLARVAAERRNLELTFDRLEDRLLANQSRVRFWREMRERHESVSAIACAVQDEHADGMALHRLPEQQHSSLHRARVAAAVSTDPAPARAPAAH